MEPILTLEQYQFKIFPKDRIAVLGPSGAGKSEFLKALTSDQTLVFDNGIIGKDPVSAAEWLQEISSPDDSRAVVVVLPTISWAKRFANRVVGLQSGRIVFDGSVEELGDEAFRKIYMNSEVASLAANTAAALRVPVSKTALSNRVAHKSYKKTNTAKSFQSSLYVGVGMFLGSLITLAIQKWILN
ncbi:MAG: ATP-binding cassette domain-containing protein [Xanthomonadaceae bacterium]|nr:ATP-binding cassette domain-containing protein [Xanthomonadaceae bacterium]